MSLSLSEKLNEVWVYFVLIVRQERDSSKSVLMDNHVFFVCFCCCLFFASLKVFTALMKTTGSMIISKS